MRAAFESSLGESLADVRVHTDDSLAASAGALGARAATAGSRVMFAPGCYAPETPAGRELLAHELVHVVQARRARTAPANVVSEPGDPAEAEAETLAAPLAESRDRRAVRQEPRARLQLRHRHRTGPSRTHRARAASPGAFARARTIAAFVALVREAERRLVAAGVTSVDDRIEVLSGIYYGTDWSVDFERERSQARNLAFRAYTARAGSGPDPRAMLGTSLVEALKRSQDVAVPGIPDVDVGHVLIGMNARSSWTPRNVAVPSQGATGLEIATWTGDLGGAAARLARARVHAPRTAASRYFSPAMRTDYGADSNLEGDIAAYLAGASAGATTLEALSVPPGGGVADALAAYFGAHGAPRNRARRFVEIMGGTFSGACLANRPRLEAAFAARFAAFGRWYLGTRYGVSELRAAWPLLPGAAAAVAHAFVDWLLRRIPGAGSCAPTAAPASGSDDGFVTETLHRLGL